ncbi:hypothetical protein BH09BAC6_BH09BAC6_24150 [soil metagenome]
MKKYLLTLITPFLLSSIFAQSLPVSLTPPAPPSPRINGPAVFGVRPGSPVIYNIPATGTRPMKFEIENMPKELTVDAATGRITGTLKTRGEYSITLKATNQFGSAEKKFRIIVGDHIALTPPMGWSSWNAFGETITQEKIENTARAMVKSGLSQHGFTYINMDDGWQGKRAGKYLGLQGNEKFPDMGALVDTIGDSDECDHSIPAQADHPFRAKLTRAFRGKLTTPNA